MLKDFAFVDRLISMHRVSEHDPLPTRASLVAALKNPSDARWQEFHQTYRGLVLGTARRAGLTHHEAEEALQETCITLIRKIPNFHYNPAKDSFKGWLLQIIRWKIADQFRKRLGQSRHAGPSDDDSTKLTAGGSLCQTPDEWPDPSASFDLLWEKEWHQFCLRQALARIRREVNPLYYAIYHLHVIEGRPVPQVSQTLDVTRAQIYLAKFRVGAALRKELERVCS